MEIRQLELRDVARALRRVRAAVDDVVLRIVLRMAVERLHEIAVRHGESCPDVRHLVARGVMVLAAHLRDVKGRLRAILLDDGISRAIVELRQDMRRVLRDGSGAVIRLCRTVKRDGEAALVDRAAPRERLHLLPARVDDLVVRGIARLDAERVADILCACVCVLFAVLLGRRRRSIDARRRICVARDKPRLAVRREMGIGNQRVVRVRFDDRIRRVVFFPDILRRRRDDLARLDDALRRVSRLDSPMIEQAVVKFIVCKPIRPFDIEIVGDILLLAVVAVLFRKACPCHRVAEARRILRKGQLVRGVWDLRFECRDVRLRLDGLPVFLMRDIVVAVVDLGDGRVRLGVERDLCDRKRRDGSFAIGEIVALRVLRQLEVIVSLRILERDGIARVRRVDMRRHLIGAAVLHDVLTVCTRLQDIAEALAVHESRRACHRDR